MNKLLHILKNNTNWEEWSLYKELYNEDFQVYIAQSQLTYNHPSFYGVQHKYQLIDANMNMEQASKIAMDASPKLHFIEFL